MEKVSKRKFNLNPSSKIPSRSGSPDGHFQQKKRNIFYAIIFFLIKETRDRESKFTLNPLSKNGFQTWNPGWQLERFHHRT